MVIFLESFSAAISSMQVSPQSKMIDVGAATEVKCHAAAHHRVSVRTNQSEWRASRFDDRGMFGAPGYTTRRRTYIKPLTCILAQQI